MFVKCSEHQKSTQLSRDFKIISSLLSKARHDLPSTELLAHYSIQFIFNSQRNFRNHKFTSLCRPSRNHENVKKVIASFILVYCVAFFFLTNPYVCILKHVGIFIAPKGNLFSRGGNTEVPRTVGQHSEVGAGHGLSNGYFTNQYGSISY